MTEREDKVYQAKLAEQAERYDGKETRVLFYVRRSPRGEWCS
jgi:hypothetical protein